MTGGATRRPLIGITGRRVSGAQLVGSLDILADLPVDLYYADNGRGVLEAGGIPVHLPLDVDPSDLLPHLDGIVLTGGADVDPGRYGHEPVTDAFPPEPLRDDDEFTVLDAALANDLPVAGICRGLQLMNVHAGGTLDQDVPSHAGFAQPATTEWHGVAFEAESILAGIYGENRQVNSLHHQTVDRLGDGLRISARSDDGSVEGIEYTSRPLVAVQWHPEMLPTRAADPLFAWLVSVASSRSLLR